MIELIAFIILFLLGIITIISENNGILRYIYIPFLVLFMVIVRVNGFYLGGYQEDIITYGVEMKYMSFDIYYLREFVFWYTLHLVYLVTHSEFITFLVFDFLWIHILLRTLKQNTSNKLGRGLIVILATSFPFFFGYENIYRQFLASILLVYSYIIIKESPSRSFKLFLLAIFIHNLSLFIIPILIMRKFLYFKLEDRIFLSISSSVIIAIAIPLMLFLKATGATIFNYSFLYLSLFLLFSLFFVFKFKENVYLIVQKIPSLIPVTILISGFVFFKQELIAERIGMLFIIFFIVDLYNYSTTIQSKLNRIWFRCFILLLFTLPVFMFSSSMLYLK